MSFFPATFYNPARADQFDSLFQLINEIDQAAQQQQQQQQQQPNQEKARQEKARQERVRQEQARQQALKEKVQKEQAARQQQQQRLLSSGAPTPDSMASDLASLFGLGNMVPQEPTFSPRFDVRETESAYHLHGELPGVERSNIHLEFVEPQVLAVSGRVERNYEKPSDAGRTARKPEEMQSNKCFSGITAPRAPSPARSLRAMVQDEEEEEAEERGVVLAEDQPMADATAPKAPAAPAARYWLQERSVGQFKRVFNFPAPVDEANVRASLENGILTVSVPKAKRQQGRRIVVF